MSNYTKPWWYKNLPWTGTFTERFVENGTPPAPTRGWGAGPCPYPWEHEWEMYAGSISFWETWSCSRCRSYLAVKKAPGENGLTFDARTRHWVDFGDRVQAAQKPRGVAQ
jgi:hypothetical protein